MTLKAINIEEGRKKTSLPDIWKKLEASGFHEDLLLRAYAHTLWSERKAAETNTPSIAHNARVFLSAMGKGFAERFKREDFAPLPEDPFYALKEHALDAIVELDVFFGDRVSSVIWDSFAHLATREEPEVKKSILKEAATGCLPHHYGILDCQLHAAGKVYTFMMTVQSVFYKHTGMILVHNCDCNCSLLNLQPVQGRVEFTLSDTQIFEASQSLFVHQCAESHLILDQKLPFEYTITGDGIALLSE
jgi:hypothetical protein